MGNQTENQTEHEQEIGIVRDFMRVGGGGGVWFLVLRMWGLGVQI